MGNGRPIGSVGGRLALSNGLGRVGLAPNQMQRDRVGIPEQTFYRWKKQYVGLEVDQFRQLKQLQEVDQKSRADQADQTLRGPGIFDPLLGLVSGKI